MNASLISIAPQYVEAILAGNKTVELRRRRPHMRPGHRLFLYATTPTKQIEGTVIFRGIEVRTVGGLWRQISRDAALARTSFLSYFDKCESAVAIHLAEPQPLAYPLTLQEIRRDSPLFHPPRTWISFNALP